MPEERDAPDLLDLKFLPAWVKETPNENRLRAIMPATRVAQSKRAKAAGPRATGATDAGAALDHPGAETGNARGRGPERRPGMRQPPEARRPPAPAPPAPAVEVRFVPDARVLESVLAQIKASHLAYSVFSLARMFLDKPERYDVRLKAETAELFQLGENGPVASDRLVLENAAFQSEKNRFYRSEVTQSEPIKGNFTSVARCRLSGIFLGPTNHHAYQSQLRSLYEQRFSRRMSFPEYQRQIEIVTSPEAVERWKEEARSVTTYVTLQEETPVTFTERGRHGAAFSTDLSAGIGSQRHGVDDRRRRQSPVGRSIVGAIDRGGVGPGIPLASQDDAGVERRFSRRAGCKFSGIAKACSLSRRFGHGLSVAASSSFSPSVAGVLAALTESPGINRKQLLEKLYPDGAGESEERERKKMALASDLHWLISEGHCD